MKISEFLDASGMIEWQVEQDSCTHYRWTERTFPITEFLELGDSLRGTLIEGGACRMLAGGEIGFDFKKKAMLVTQCDGCGRLLPKYRQVGDEKSEELEKMLREVFKDEKVRDETVKEFEELKVEGADEKITYGDPLGDPQPWGSEPQPLMWPLDLEECPHSKEIVKETNPLEWIGDYWVAEWGREETIARIKKGMIILDLAKGLEIEGDCVECKGLAPITDPCTEEEANAILDKALDYLGRKKKEKEVEEITKENELKEEQRQKEGWEPVGLDYEPLPDEEVKVGASGDAYLDNFGEVKVGRMTKYARKRQGNTEEERLDLFYRKEEEPNPIGISEGTVEKVVHPKHYQLEGLGLEVMDIMRAVMTKEQLRGFHTGNTIKYILRAEKKNGLEDYKKAHYYLGELIKEEEDEIKD